MEVIFNSPEHVSIPLLEQNFFGKKERIFKQNDELPGSHQKSVPQVNVRWNNIRYSVTSRRKKEKKVILKDVSGRALPGELMAILGPSGSGKSTLLNILSRFIFRNVGGEVLLNGSNDFVKKRISGYVMQDDVLLPYLTVKELVNMAADLKCPETYNWKKKNTMVEEVICALGLTECMNTKSNYLSGGERKRVCIAQELIMCPPVLFLDEPTSGLDSLTCLLCVKLLKKLSEQGHTVVCSIHQPSTHLLNYFDKLYILSEGECIYNGTLPDLLPFLSSHGLNCPQYHNPADFIIEVASGVFGSYVDQLKIAFKNNESSEELSVAFAAQKELKSTKRRKICKENVEFQEYWYSTSSWTQFKVIILLSYKSIYRDPVFTQMRFAATTLLGLLIGWLYWRIGNAASEVLDNISFLRFSVVFHLYTSVVAAVLTFTKDLAVYLRENHNKWHRSWVYFLAKTLADIPFQMLYTLIFCGITYGMTNQPGQFYRFGLFFYGCCIASLTSQSLGIICGTVTGFEKENFLAPASVILPLLLSNLFLKVDDLNIYLRWLPHLSFVKYMVQIIIQSIYGYDRPDLECNEVTGCLFTRPKSLMDFMDFQDSTIIDDIFILSAFFLVIRASGYIALLWKICRRQ